PDRLRARRPNGPDPRRPHLHRGAAPHRSDGGRRRGHDRRRVRGPRPRRPPAAAARVPHDARDAGAGAAGAGGGPCRGVAARGRGEWRCRWRRRCARAIASGPGGRRMTTLETIADRVDAHPDGPLLVAEGVTRVFETAAGPVVALAEATMEVHPGELVVIRGRSGSGKTTLLNVLSGLDRPTAGTVVVNGVDLTTADEAALVE